MRWLVCGGREFASFGWLTVVLDELVVVRGGPEGVVHGGQRGADRMAGTWAEYRGIPVWEFPADWKRYGWPSAGPIRNGQMLREAQPGLVVAFPGGNGTANLARQARDFGVEIVWAGQAPV